MVHREIETMFLIILLDTTKDSIDFFHALMSYISYIIKDLIIEKPYTILIFLVFCLIILYLSHVAQKQLQKIQIRIEEKS